MPKQIIWFLIFAEKVEFEIHHVNGIFQTGVLALGKLA